MCFFNSQNKRALEIAKRYGRKSDIVEIAREILEEQKRERIEKSGEMGEKVKAGEGSVQKAFLCPDCLIVTPNEQLQQAKWGLIPFWVKDITQAESIRKVTANARSETALYSAVYRFL